MKIAICGAGVAGPSLAHWLLRGGHEVTLIEIAPTFRDGGYIVDFWGLGYDIAERMGILPAVLDAGYSIRRVAAVDDKGREIAGFSADAFRKAANGRFTSLARGDLARSIFDTVKDRAELLFGETILRVRESEKALSIQLSSGGWREFDLLVGADGLHSAVRRHVFGPDGRFEVPLGYYVAAWEAPGYRRRDELTYLTHTRPGREMARFALRGDRTLFLFMFEASALPEEPDSRADTEAALRRIFAGDGWEADAMLETLPHAEELYLDRVSQIVMPSWSSGRTVLVGDAAACVSLLAGEGAGLGMAEAYVLAGELATGDHQRAFERYEARLRPLLTRKQASARRFATYFAPKTAMGVRARNLMMRLLSVPVLGEWLVARDLRDDFDLPDYPFAPPSS
ncbi:MAG TPA: FAD-binding domain [Caulobacteraceae bacterium]